MSMLSDNIVIEL